LTETEILLNFENLVGATENAGLSMATGMLALLEHPDEWRRLREDRSLLPTAIEELLRWASSATHSMRTATHPCVLADQQIETGDRVVLWLPSANRDETAFADPDALDLGRRPNKHLALGFGEHACIGGSMARVQLGILLEELLDRVREIEQVAPAVPLRSIVVNGPAHLPVRLTAR
jgi:cytochrome P450